MLCWNVNKNCGVDVASDRKQLVAQQISVLQVAEHVINLKKKQKKTTLQVLISVLQVAATCDQSKKQQEKTTLQVLISSFFLLRQPLLRVFKVLFFYRLCC